jgi:uncharacterized membrane protein
MEQPRTPGGSDRSCAIPEDHDPRSWSASAVSRRLLAALFVLAGTLHFLFPSIYVGIMPPYLPWHRELVFLSGMLEILGGLGLLIRRTRRAAAVGLVLLLLAVAPANLNMALDARAVGHPLWWQAVLWIRLPIQLLLIAWVWYVGQITSRREAASTA